MRGKAMGVGWAVVLALAAPAMAQSPAPKNISGDYVEFRTAEVYTGPCFANSEEGLTGHEGVLAWHIREGAWKKVRLDGLSVVAVVRARATLGDPFENPLPGKAVVIVDERASRVQQAALVDFAKAQAPGLLDQIVAIAPAPIKFLVNVGGRHGYDALRAGSVVRLSTRVLCRQDEFCHNERVYYSPLALHLDHVMPAVVLESAYQGGYLGVQWNDAGGRSAFVGSFAL